MLSLPPILGALPSEAITFFAVFSRAEYALKRNNYGVMIGGRLAVQWDRFAMEIPDFVTYVRDTGEADTLLSAPPKNQILDGQGALTWRDAVPVGDDPRALFAAIRRVRNNLFHGGKQFGQNTDTSRDVALLSQSTWVRRHGNGPSPEYRDRCHLQ